MKFSFLIWFFSSFALGICPLVEQGEKAEDCPWAEVAREMESLQNDPRAMDALFASRLPGLRESIERDAKEKELLALWGQSLNFDENAKAEITLGPWLDRLLNFAGVEPRKGQVVHAGIEHTYGYLFSTLRTPFGYKRARWVRGDIEKDLDLVPGELSPSPSSGTLFANVTRLLAKIARGENRTATRVVETVVDGDRRVELRTDFVAGRTGYLLVYSLEDSRAKKNFLITAFPVEATFFEKVTSPQTEGDDQVIRAQYNAYLEGFSGREWRGNRRVERARTTGERPSGRR